MKAKFLLLLSVIALNVSGQETKKDTIDRYVVNKQVIERFDGSQLEGKTISKYIIAYKNVGNYVEKNHVIITENPKIKLNGRAENIEYEGLVLVDGKEVTASYINNLAPDNIANMNVFKPGSKVAKSYGEKGKNGVMMITTKANKDAGMVYFIDGKRVDKKEVENLSADEIATMNVNKKDGTTVITIVRKNKI